MVELKMRPSNFTLGSYNKTWLLSVMVGGTLTLGVILQKCTAIFLAVENLNPFSLAQSEVEFH